MQRARGTRKKIGQTGRDNDGVVDCPNEPGSYNVESIGSRFRRWTYLCGRFVSFSRGKRARLWRLRTGKRARRCVTKQHRDMDELSENRTVKDEHKS